MRRRMTLVYLIAGEPSGDALGGRLMAALKVLRPELQFAGIGGPLMQDQGLASLFPMRELALMGLLEVLPRLRLLRRRFDQTLADIAARKPALVVTIDSPGFTLRVLKAVAAMGIARAHYVAPQVWAWRENRVRKYPGLWDALLCLLPFEPAFFARHGLPARFVGHPVLESGADLGDAARFRARHGLAPEAVPLILMPGSRRTETGPLLPILGKTLALLRLQIPGLIPVVPVATAMEQVVAAGTATWKPRPIIVTDAAEKYDAFAAAAAALTKSGTSTLELALAGVPMVVAYRVNPLTAAIVRRLVRVRYASILNLIADRAVIPELIQEECTPERLATTLAPLLLDAAAAEAQRAAFRPLLAALRAPEGLPSAAAAQAVLGLLDKA
jgi:lipid-A-disaccharide synthase